MSLVRKRISASGIRRAVIAVAALALVCSVGMSEQSGPSLERLYEAARMAYTSGDVQTREVAAMAVVARGAEAVKFLAARLELQAENVHDAGEAKAGGIFVTINLLGRMNSYPAARSALIKLQAHPVAEVGKWAKFALSRTPQTQPGRPVKTTRPTTTEPATVRIEGDRLITPDGWFARPKVKHPPLPEKITNAFIIPIREPITPKTTRAIRRKAHAARKEHAQLIIFDMDTFGGGVVAALDISEIIKKDLQDIYTVCFVHTDAISAGALIALACDEIVMTPSATLGDCAPIAVGGKLEGVLREKVESPLRSEFRDSARRNGYPIALAMSMVSFDIEVWKVRNRITRELQYVLKREWLGKVEIPPGLATGPSKPTSEWELLQVVVREGELLTMNTSEALKYRFASRRLKAPAADPYLNLKSAYNITAGPVVLSDTWSEQLVEFLTSAPVMAFLFFVGLLCAYAEVHTPGFGGAGAAAIVCFAIIFGSHYLVGLAQWWEIALFFIGVALLAVEVFLIPGFGVAGVAGLLCCVAALLAMMVDNAPTEFPWPDTEGAWEMLKTGVLWMMAAFVAATVTAAALARFLPKVPIAGRLVLAAPEGSLTAPTTEDAPILDVRPGQVGEVTQTCRPVGKVRIDGRLVDAVADGAFIEAGAEVVVLRNEGNRVVVETKA